MKPRPAFSMYAAEFFSDTAALSQAEVGALVRIMCQYWRHGKMPDNLEAWALGEVSDAVRRQVVVEVERLDELRAECEALSNVRSKAARDRWEKPMPKKKEPAQPIVEVIPLGVSHRMWIAIKAWKAYRAEIKRPIKASSLDAFVRRCIEWGEDRTVAAVEHSIAQGWQGCYEPDKNNGKANQAHRSLTFAERVAAAAGITPDRGNGPDAG